MCSVKASGTAAFVYDDSRPVNLKGVMYRVGDYVFYSVTDNNMNVMAAVLVRPDLNKTFLWMNGMGCIERPALNLSTYQHIQDKTFAQTVQGPDGPLSGSITFDDSDKLIDESVSVLFSDGVEIHSVTVSYAYNSWNYSFVNENADFFKMMTGFHCAASSTTPAPEAKTSVQCTTPPPPPSGSASGGSTSNSTSGGGSTSGSTSGGSASGGGSTSNSTSGGSTSGSTSGKTGEIPADMCSVEAMGSAVLTADGFPYPGQLVARMMRVKNYAQYALIDSTTGNVTAAVLMRPDTGKTYLWMADEDCIERPALNLFSYEHVAGKTFSKTVTDPYGDLTGSITFDGSDKLSAETIQVAFTQGGESHTVRVAITYTPILVNYSFVNEDDDEFMAPASMSCGAASMTPAADAKTSLQCSATSSTTPTPSSSTKPTPTPSSSTKPTPSTSSSTKPTPPPPASSSAASFVVPSAMLLVAAVVAMF